MKEKELRKKAIALTVKENIKFLFTTFGILLLIIGIPTLLMCGLVYLSTMFPTFNLIMEYTAKGLSVIAAICIVLWTGGLIVDGFKKDYQENLQKIENDVAE